MSDHRVARFNNEELCAWLTRDNRSEFKNEDDMVAICEAMRVNEIDGESFVDLAEPDIVGLFPEGTTRFILRRKQVRAIVSRLGNMEVPRAPHAGDRVDRVAVQPVEFMLVQTPGITEPEIPERTYHSIVQDQVAVMITATKELVPPRNPTHAELEQVARRLVQKYPGLKAEGEDAKDAHILLLTRMKKRMYNKTPSKTTRGPHKKKEAPDATALRRSPRKRKQMDQETHNHSSQEDTVGASAAASKAGPSGASAAASKAGPSGAACKGKKVRRELMSTPPEQTDQQETAYTMERHAALLQKELEKKKPNYQTVAQLLDLEFPARRVFAVSASQGVTRTVQVIERYPCFSQARHLQDELRRYVAMEDPDFLDKLKRKLPQEAEVLVNYAIREEVCGSANMASWTDCKKMRKALQVLPELFKGTTSPPVPRKDMLVVLLKADGSVQAEMKRNKRRTAYIIVKQASGGQQVFVIIHGKALVECRSVVEGFVSLIGALYCFQQPHPTSIAPAMVFIEHHLLKDPNVNKADLTPSFSKAYAKYQSFMNGRDSGSETE